MESLVREAVTAVLDAADEGQEPSLSPAAVAVIRELDFRLARCPAEGCDGTGQVAGVICTECQGGGFLPEHRARPIREQRWPARTEAENAALLRQWGERNPRDIPKTRLPYLDPLKVAAAE